MSKACLCRPAKLMLLMYLLWTVMVMQAYMHNFNAEYLALFMVIGMTFSLLFFTKHNISALRVRYLSTQRAFADTPTTLHFSIESDKNRFNLYALPPFEPVLFSLHTPSTLIGVNYAAKKRGVYTVEMLPLQTRYPIGLFKCSCPYKVDTQLFVAPKPYGIALETLLQQKQKQWGEYDEFQGHKTYEYGEKLGQIDWKASAKTDTLLTKKFSHLVKENSLLFEYEYAGYSKEEKLSQLCLWVLECEKYALAFRIAMPEETFDSATMSIDEILVRFARY